MDLQKTLINFDNKTAFICDNGVKLSYRQLLARALDLCSRIGRRKRLILISCQQDIETVVAYLAARLGGHAALLIDYKLNDVLKDKLIAHYRPNYWWCCKKNTTHYDLLELDQSPHAFLHPQLSILLPTSGSTGSPKLVRLSEQNIMANAQSIVEYLDIKGSDRPIVSLPFHYSYGLSVLNTHLLVGATILLTAASLSQGSFWGFFRSGGGNSIAGVPFNYEMLKRLGFESMQLENLRYMTQAGGKLDDSLIEYILTLAEERGFKFYVMYGQTEATARIAYLPYELAREKLGSVGIPIPNGKWWLQDSQKNRIERPFVKGEIVYNGPNVMMGYAETLEDLSRGDDLGGVLETGDLAYFDTDGFCFITGRKKRFVKVFGNRYSLDEIEHALNQVGVECRVGGFDNQILIAVKQFGNTDLVHDQLTRVFNLHHSTFEIFTVNEFPIASNGKIKYAELFGKYNKVS